MKVRLLSHTLIDRTAMAEIGYSVHRSPREDGWGDYFTEEPADELAEFAGRNCYQSFHRPNPKTAANRDYLAHILRSGHESVLEHASATFYIEASRSVLTELERHRHLSFSVVSQRYVNVEDLKDPNHIPPALRGNMHARGILSQVWDKAIDGYNEIVEDLIDAGSTRKQAREAARAVLPNMTSSPMVVTGNHRAWRYVIKARYHEAADAEIRELAGELLRQLRGIAPNSYADIPEEPYV